jgi:hypothetical protein
MKPPSDQVLNEWLTETDIFGILPDHLVIRVLQGATHYDFSGNPVILASELEDRVGLVLRDRNTTEGNA